MRLLPPNDIIEESISAEDEKRRKREDLKKELGASLLRTMRVPTRKTAPAQKTNQEASRTAADLPEEAVVPEVAV